MSESKSFRVLLEPAIPGARCTVLSLDEEQLTDMTSAMNFGSGWFPYEDGHERTWFNLNQYQLVAIEEERK